MRNKLHKGVQSDTNKFLHQNPNFNTQKPKSTQEGPRIYSNDNNEYLEMERSITKYAIIINSKTEDPKFLTTLLKNNK